MHPLIALLMIKKMIKEEKDMTDRSEALKAAEKALKARVPQKVKCIGERYSCPGCNKNNTLLVGDLYCTECGQALEWRDLEVFKGE